MIETARKGEHMKLAIVGSRNIGDIDIGMYLPDGVDEIVSGGAKGADTLARKYAEEHGIKLTEFLPKYDLFGRSAPLKRNEEIVRYADEGIAFWDGKSRGTKYTIDAFRKLGKKVQIVLI